MAIYIKGVRCTDGCGTNPCGGASPCPTPVITSAASYVACVGDYFYYQITATNSPSSYSASNIPAGASLNSTTGLISGTLTATTTTPMSVWASNACGSGSSLAVAITIDSPACSGVSIYGGQDPCGPLNATCVDQTYSVSGLFSCAKSVRVMGYAPSPLSIAFSLYADSTLIITPSCGWPFNYDTYVSIPAGTTSLRVVIVGDCDNSNIYGPVTFSITCS